jgi:hypothetical protein
MLLEDKEMTQILSTISFYFPTGLISYHYLLALINQKGGSA